MSTKHKTNGYDQLCTITVFCAAISILGIGVTVNADGEHEAAAAGTMPDVIYTEGGVAASEAVQGAVPNGGAIKVLAGAAVAAGVDVTTDAAGKFITATTGDTIVGRSVTAAGAIDAYFKILFGNKGVKA